MAKKFVVKKKPVAVVIVQIQQRSTQHPLVWTDLTLDGSLLHCPTLMAAYAAVSRMATVGDKLRYRVVTVHP